MIFFQVKGGKTNRVKPEHRKRLRKAVSKAEIAFNCSEKREKTVDFYWEPTDEEFDLHKTRT